MCIHAVKTIYYTLIERRNNVKILSNDVNVMACSGYTLHTL